MGTSALRTEGMTDPRTKAGSQVHVRARLPIVLKSVNAGQGGETRKEMESIRG